MKKRILIGIAIFSLTLVSPTMAQAQTAALSSSQISAALASFLESLGVSQAVIANVQAALLGKLSGSGQSSSSSGLSVGVLANGKSGSETVEAGSSITLSWTSTGASSCKLSASPSTLSWFGTVPLSGERTLGYLATSRSYYATCSNDAHVSVTGSVMVNVNPPANIATNNGNTSGNTSGNANAGTNNKYVGPTGTPNSCTVSVAHGFNGGLFGIGTFVYDCNCGMTKVSSDQNMSDADALSLAKSMGLCITNKAASASSP